MKITITICFLIIFSTTIFSQKKLNGVWEFNGGDTFRGRHIRNFYLPANHFFWIKFSDEEIIISNSNNKYAFEWSSNVGEWHQNSDTIFIKIYENESVQPYSNKMPYEKLDPTTNIRFLITELTDSSLELLPLDKFIGSKNYRNFHNETGIGEYECFTMKRTTEDFYWNDKIQDKK